MTLKEKKREVSKLVGKNLFDKEYKDLVKQLFGEESEEEEENTNDSETTTDNKEETKTEPEAKDNPDSDKKEEEENKLEEPKETDAEKEAEGKSDKEEKAEEGDATETEETKEADEDGGDATDGKEEENADGDNDAGSNTDNSQELFDAKLESKLLRVGIREDKIEAAKKLFKTDHTIDDIEKVEEWVKEYPEWTKQKNKEEAKGFGMDVGEHETAETAEERRLKELGIT